MPMLEQQRFSLLSLRSLVKWLFDNKYLLCYKCIVLTNGVKNRGKKSRL